VELALIAVACGAAAGVIAGRRPPGPGPVPRLALLLIGAGIVCETAASEWLPSVLAGYALLIAAAILEHRRLGTVLVAAGLLANLLVITVNRGMPVKGLASGAAPGSLHHALATGDRLVGLSDIIRLPLVSAMVSPGDVVLALGAAVMMFGWLEPRTR
jgi:hypothetical protein